MRYVLFWSFALLLAARSPERLMLREGRSLQSSAQVSESGGAICTAGFQPRNWYHARIPSTVLNALVTAKLYPDPYFGMNLRSIPGTSYPIGQSFSNLPMPDDSPFKSSWWFRTEFRVPAAYSGKTVWLHFKGINYRANLWLNGRRLASSREMAGAWRLFEYNVSDAVRPGQINCLALEIFPPQPNDLAITLVDWNPMPPDKLMGIWRDVWLTTSGPVAIRFPYVVSRLNPPANDCAEITVGAELRNASHQPVEGTLKGRIGKIEFTQPVRLAAGQTSVVKLLPTKFPQLRIQNPRLWWPVQVRPQNR